MPASHVLVPTEHASRYLQQLCKHWAHKFDTEFTPDEGRVALPLGETHMSASATGLEIGLEAADEAGLVQLQQVVQVHVERFAFRETLDFDWKPAPDAA